MWYNNNIRKLLNISINFNILRKCYLNTSVWWTAMMNNRLLEYVKIYSVSKSTEGYVLIANKLIKKRIGNLSWLILKMLKELRK